MLMIILSTFLLATGSVVQSQKLPSVFPVCKREDPKLNECLLAAMEKSVVALKNGIRELDMLPLDPLEITKIQFSEGNGPVKLKIDLTDTKLYGLSSIKLSNVSFIGSAGKYILYVIGIVPLIQFEADYAMDGKFSILPIKGEGKYYSNGTGFEVHIHLPCEEYTKDGATYCNIGDVKVFFPKVEKIFFNFDNLFNGDKTLGESTNTLFNENWPDLWAELKAPLEDVYAQVYKIYTKKFFDNYPFNEILVD